MTVDQKWFPRLNHFYTQINRGHQRKAGGYSGQNVVKKKNKDEDNSPTTLTDKNHQASSQKFRQVKSSCVLFIRTFLTCKCDSF